MRVVSISLAVLGLFCSRASADSVYGYLSHNLFLPESYIATPVVFSSYPASPGERDLGPDSTPILYEARIAPHLFLYSNVHRLGYDDAQAWSLSFTPDIVLRQLSGGSLPVSSPSFRPTITGQYFRQWAVVPQRGIVHLHMLVPQLFLGHYSNGSAADTLPEGNFSLQRAGVSLGYRLMRFLHDEELGWPVRPTHAVEAALGWQYNVPPMARELRDSYGGGRFTGTFAHEWTHFGSNDKSPQPELRLRSSIEVTLAHGVGNSVPLWSTSTTVALTFRRALGFGPLLRLVNGADYYNIRFASRFDALFLGVLWEGGVLEYNGTRVPKAARPKAAQ